MYPPAIRFVGFRLGVSPHLLALLLAANAIGCASRAKPAAKAPSSSRQVPARPAAKSHFGVLNQCFVVGDRFLLHARIDARSANGRVYRQVWSFTCKGDDCDGAELSLDPFYEGRALGALDLNVFKHAKAQMHYPSRYIIEFGAYAFRVDLVAGLVDLNGPSMPGRDVGSAPCSKKGVLWPPDSAGVGPGRAALDAETRRK